MDPPLQRFFRKPPPSSPDACRIWNECCLPDIIDATAIYWALDTWARLNCLIEIREERPYVFWISPSGVRHECFADTFAHWLICACEEIKPQAAQQPPLTPVSEIQPSWNNEEMLQPQPQEEEEVKNEIIFHDVQKVDDSADNAIEENMIQTLSLTFDEIVHMNLEQFLTEEEVTEEH